MSTEKHVVLEIEVIGFDMEDYITIGCSDIELPEQPVG